MKLTTTLTIFLLTVLSSTLVSAQHYSISGNILDKESKQISDVSISLLNATDSSWLQTIRSNADGAYILNNVVAGKYILHIQSLGHEQIKKNVTVMGDVRGLDILLVVNGNKLQDALVVERRNTIQTDLGKTVVNINKELKAGKSLLDLLRDVPGVVVSGADEVSMQGKQGVVVIIDEKPVHLSGKALSEYLKGVDASNIDKIELMTQPSAKYDAQGNSGFIIVKLTEDKKEGWNGNLSARYSQGMYPYTAENATVNYRKRKFGLRIAPGYYYGESFLIPDNITRSKDINTGEVIATNKENGFLKERFSDSKIELAADYDLSSKTTISASVQGMHHPNEETDKVISQVDDLVTNTSIKNISQNDRGFLRNNMQTNLFVKHDIDSDHNIVLNGDHHYMNRYIFQKLTSTNYDASGLTLPGSLLLKNGIPIQSDIYSVKVDYAGKLKKDTELEAGAKASTVSIDEANNFSIYKNNSWVNDSVRSNHFLYNEQIVAGYVSASTEKGKWQAKAGVRVEHTNANGHELVSDNKFTRAYTSVFPTTFVSYTPDDKNTVECNYGKRIQRPFYRELNPFTSITSQYNSATGNPNLLPMFTHNVELKHNYRSKMITTVSYTVVNGVFTRELRFDNATKVSNYSTTNNGRKVRSALSAYYNKQINSWWGVSLTGEAHYVEYEGRFNGNTIYASAVGCHMNIDTQLTFNNGWYAHARVWYNSPFQVSAINRAGSSVFISSEVSKSILNDTANIKLSIRDPFRWYKRNENYELPNVSTATNSIYNTQNVVLAFNYNFGNKENKSIRKGKAIEEAGRM